ncbi:MAG: DUF4921 family protein [bacterium]|nr:DUF4921 family protein [bacterium]
MSDLNEFRQDLVSGDWVLFAAGRSKRTNATEKAVVAEEHQDARPCPFDDPRATGQEIISEYKKENGELWVTVIKNKYPAVASQVCMPIETNGPFSWTAANGFHEVVVTNDHQRIFPDFTLEETTIVLKSYRERYLDIAKNECGEYIQIFNNFGKNAGASIVHPHSQILSTPILPPVVARSINGSAEFYRKNKKKVHDTILEWEMKQEKRIIFENEFFIAFCPFTSKRPYEVRIFPKLSNARFETIDNQSMEGCAEALNFVLGKLKKVFDGRFNFNFFIHTSPVRESPDLPCSEFYHWHIEIIPHYSILAGFDFSTGIVVNVIDPDQAAEELRKI